MSEPPRQPPQESSREGRVDAPPRRAGTPGPRHPIRWLWVSAGLLCVALGALGTFLPLLPTTPFMLLAAACFARGSERFHDWLLAHRLFGPTIRSWRARRALPPRVKGKAIALVVVTIGASAWMLSSPVGRVAALVVGGALVVFLARLPVWDEREDARPVPVPDA